MLLRPVVWPQCRVCGRQCLHLCRGRVPLQSLPRETCRQPAQGQARTASPSAPAPARGPWRVFRPLCALCRNTPWPPWAERLLRCWLLAEEGAGAAGQPVQEHSSWRFLSRAGSFEWLSCQMTILCALPNWCSGEIDFCLCHCCWSPAASLLRDYVPPDEFCFQPPQHPSSTFLEGRV